MDVGSAYTQNPKSASEVLVCSLIEGTELNYLVHKSCVYISSADAHKQREYSEIKILTRRKDLTDGAGSNLLHKAMENGAWLMAIP